MKSNIWVKYILVILTNKKWFLKNCTSIKTVKLNFYRNEPDKMLFYCRIFDLLKKNNPKIELALQKSFNRKKQCIMLISFLFCNFSILTYAAFISFTFFTITIPFLEICMYNSLEFGYQAFRRVIPAQI